MMEYMKEGEQKIKEQDFHAMRADSVCSFFGVDYKDGLTQSMVEERQVRDGANVLSMQAPRTWIHVLLGQFRSPLMWVIVVAAVISFMIGHAVDAMFISVVIALNTILGAFQEMKAERALEKLKNALTFRATVLRDGAKKEIDSSDVVVGDIVFLIPGTRVAADGRILSAQDLLVNEAVLSGESVPERKEDSILSSEVLSTDRTNMIYAGTTVADGSGQFVVTAISGATEMGKIAALIDTAEERQSPLTRSLERFALWVTVAILGMIALFVWIGLAKNQPFDEVMIAAVALVVSTIPEGLLPAITVVLVLGMRRLARKKALVRRLSAVETMGAVSVICMDKTGTLTTGEMRVSHVIAANEEAVAVGDEKSVSAMDALHMRALTIGFLVNDAVIENPESVTDAWIVRGRPTDRALALAGLQAGLRQKTCVAQRKLVSQVLFTSQRKHAVRVYQLLDGRYETLLLGAAEQVLERCTSMRTLTGTQMMTVQDRAQLLSRVEKLTREGYRLLACADRQDVEDNEEDYEMCFVGFLALKDPARHDVQVAIMTAQRAGVRPIVITGDHHNTATAILCDVGMDVDREHVFDGSDMDALSDEELQGVVRHAQLFARVLPAHKIRIIHALMHNDEVVAMVGDGVNDAPALKAADVGIAIGSGTDLAKTVADVVLLDDSFATIVSAIREGRLVLLNIKRLIFFLLVDDFTEIILFFVALMVGAPLPLLPAQILWINLIEDGLPGMALTASRNGSSLMKQGPQRLSQMLFSRETLIFASIVFVLSTVSALGLYFGLLARDVPIEVVRTSLFVLMSIDSLLFAYVMHTFDESLISRTLFSNKYLNWSVVASFVILLAGVHVPFLQSILHTVPLASDLWVMIGSIAVVEIVIFDIAKRFIIINHQKIS